MESSQTDLEGKTVTTPPTPAGEGLVLCADVKDIAHHTRGGGTNVVSLFANLPTDDEGKRFGTCNLNLSNLKETGLKAIAEALGIEKLVDNTPLLVRIYVPTGALLEHWTQNRPGKDDDKE